MSFSIIDAKVFAAEIKAARKRKHITQAECAELLEISLAYQKDLERGRTSPSVDMFFHICRTLGISADNCVYPEKYQPNSPYSELMRITSQFDEKQIEFMLSTAIALQKMK